MPTPTPPPQVRFVIGHSTDPAAEAAFADEEAAHGGVLRLGLVEGYQSLPAKTVAFLRAATQQWDPEYIVKVGLVPAYCWS